MKGSKGELEDSDKLSTGAMTVAKLIPPILVKKAKTTLPPLKIILFLSKVTFSPLPKLPYFN